MADILRFEPFSSTVEPEFWIRLGDHKLKHAKLDKDRMAISGEFTSGFRHVVRDARSGQTVAVPARLRVSNNSTPWNSAAEKEEEVRALGPAKVNVPGWLYNMNTVEEFKQFDKPRVLRDIGMQVLEDIRSGVVAGGEDESLWPFVLVSFADLKKFVFYHWFAFPAITADPPDTVSSAKSLMEVVALASDLRVFEETVGGFLAEGRRKGKKGVSGAFLVSYNGQSGSADEGHKPWRVGSLAEWDSFFTNNGADDDCVPMLAFVDPSSHATRPGWPLRNLLTWVRHMKPNVKQIKVLCYRYTNLSGYSEELDSNNREGAPEAYYSESIVIDIIVTPASELKSEMQVSGWERNQNQKLAPRKANLSSTMDPTNLSESALDLNLQLMRWRLAPGINLDIMRDSRVLLIGAGTLGTYVARGLLAWGVRNITFVDNGQVSFSNPPRQPLFEFSDAVDGGKPKAKAAADAMRRIFPNIHSLGVQLSVPMPGHSVSAAEVESTKHAVSELEALISQHDAVFLLTDSRESRWLPTMLAAKHRKLAICVALGFDSYVAMRHGVRPKDTSSEDDKHQHLGCYFCNDVVAPTDSMTDRTLDQQCTVTRPGLAPIASGVATELFVTVQQHPDGKFAAAPQERHPESDSEDDDGVFGIPEHQIRGYLAGFRQHKVTGHAYDKCTGCSGKVIDAYEQHGFEFLLRVFNNALVSEDDPHTEIKSGDEGKRVDGVPYSYLETLTGLAALHRQTESMLDDIEWSEEE